MLESESELCLQLLSTAVFNLRTCVVFIHGVIEETLQHFVNLHQNIMCGSRFKFVTIFEHNFSRDKHDFFSVSFSSVYLGSEKDDHRSRNDLQKEAEKNDDAKLKFRIAHHNAVKTIENSPLR